MKDSIDLTSLNIAQRAAVEYISGPSLVIAGAGSGKTRVLTYKIAHLLANGVKPWNILALTFTNKAANEMKERIIQLVGEDARYLNMGTFHSIFSRILRSEAASIGYTPQFTIYDESDSRSLLKAIVKELGLDDKIYKPASVHNRISMAKNYIELPSDYALSTSYASRDRDSRMEKMPQIYEIYQQRLRQANAMDFDDLLLYTYLLFSKNEDIRQKYGERFRYVLVDEYQDTNSVQQSIVLQIVRDYHNVCVVGDDAQSIYGFRGANIDNILDFQKRFATEETPVRLFKLEQNYRSTQQIVSAANSLIQHNQRQIRKEVFSENAQGEPLQLKYCYSDREEAIIVCKDVRRLRRSENFQYSDFAILYRTNAQSRTFEEQMRKDGIPYRIYGGLSFYQRKEIKDVIAYFRLVVNNHDEEALRRIINYPTRGIGNTTVDKVLAHARALNISPWDVISQPVAVGLEVSKATLNKLIGFAEKIKSYSEDLSDAYTLGTHIVQDSGIAKDIYAGKEPDDISRQENLQELLDSLREFVDTRREEGEEEHLYLADFLQEVSLMTDLDSDDGSDDKVVLMTIHAAKGLEFPVVFVVGMEENIFPSPMCADSMRGLEEERRLLYVAITRAEQYCILTSAQNRYRYGHVEFDTPSRFLRDINPAFMRVTDLQKGSDTNDMPWSRQRPSYSSSSPSSPFASPRSSSSTPFPASRPSIPAPRPSASTLRTSEQSSRPSASIPRPSVPQPGVTHTGRRLVPVNSSVSAPHNVGGFTPLSVGDKIEHARFGVGTVLKVEGTGENTKAHVEFVNAGTKQLLVKFAKFRKI